MIKKFEKQIIIAVVLGFIVSSSLAIFGNLEQIINQLKTFKYWLVLPIILLTLLNYIFRFFRWQYYLSVIGFSKKLKIKDSALIFFAGLSMTITPGKAGEIIKSYFLKKFQKNNISETMPVIVIERFTDGLAALFLMSGGLLINKYGIPFFIITMIFSLLFILMMQNKSICLLILRFLGKIRIFNKYINPLAKFYENSHKIVQWRHLLAGMVLGIIAWGAESYGLFLVLDGIGIATNLEMFFTCMFIFCFSGVIGFATLLPAGIGVTEGTTTGLLMLLLTLNKSQAVSATLIDRLLTLWIGVAIGFVALSILLKKQHNYDN